MATIVINKTEYPALKDCQVGEKLDLDGAVTVIDGDELTIDVSDVTYGSDEADQPADVPAKPAPKGGPPRAIVAIGIPGGRAKGY